MEERAGTGRRAKKQELAAGVLHRELASFRDLLNEPISAERLNLWIATNKVRQSLTADTIGGTIQWPRSFGLPRTLILTSAFVIEHRLWQREATNAQVGPITCDLLITDVSLQKWDGPHDAKYYRVSFMSHRMLGIRASFSLTSRRTPPGRVRAGPPFSFVEGYLHPRSSSTILKTTRRSRCRRSRWSTSGSSGKRRAGEKAAWRDGAAIRSAPTALTAMIARPA